MSAQHHHQYEVRVHDVTADVRVDPHAPWRLAMFGIVHVGADDDSQFHHEVARRLLEVLRQAADDLEHGMKIHKNERK